MGRPKGIRKPPGSGRKPGTPNKVPSALVIKETFAEACRRLNFDPLAKLAAIIESLEPVDQARTLVQILPYLHAQVKVTEAPAANPFATLGNIDRAALLQAASAQGGEEARQ